MFKFPGGQPLLGIKWDIIIVLLEILVLKETKNKIYHILLKLSLDRKSAIIQG